MDHNEILNIGSCADFYVKHFSAHDGIRPDRAFSTRNLTEQKCAFMYPSGIIDLDSFFFDDIGFPR